MSEIKNLPRLDNSQEENPASSICGRQLESSPTHMGSRGEEHNSLWKQLEIYACQENITGNKKPKPANKSKLRSQKSKAYGVSLKPKHARPITPRFESIVGEHTHRLNPPLDASYCARKKGSKMKISKVIVKVPISRRE